MLVGHLTFHDVGGSGNEGEIINMIISLLVIIIVIFAIRFALKFFNQGLKKYLIIAAILFFGLLVVNQF